MRLALPFTLALVWQAANAQANDFAALAGRCAIGVHPATMAAVASVESGFNPLAIGVVGGQLARQPITKAEAVATAIALERDGFNFSLGVSQINRFNLRRFGLDYAGAFEPCDNLRVGGRILSDCFARAKASSPGDQRALQAALSCYYSGNFFTGFRQDVAGQPSYVQKVLTSAGASVIGLVAPIPVIRSAQAARAVSHPAVAAIRARSGVDADAQITPRTDVYGDASDSAMVFR